MEYQKTAKATGDLISNKIEKVSKNSQRSNAETVINENDKEIPKERYVFPEERQKIIDILTFNIILSWCNNGISKNNKFVRKYTKSII